MRSKTPSFIAEFPLRVTAADERELEIRFDAARQIYNASLGESLRRSKLMRESRAWQAARLLPKSTKTEKAERSKAFKEVAEEHGFTSASIQKFAEGCRDACWIGEHLGSHDTQTTSLRAFKAVQDSIFKGRDAPRFKGKNRLHSVEGKGDAVIRLRVVDGKPTVLWSGLSMPLMLDPKDKHGWQKQAMECDTKYVRVLRRKVHGITRWYAQIVKEGKPPKKKKNHVYEGTVGLDLGPSTIAIVGESTASLEMFCPKVEVPAREIRRLQRAMDRSRRATNPEAYNANGTFKKGVKITTRSKNYRETASLKSDLERRLAAERKRSQGELANRILCLGDTVKMEKLSYVAFQKIFGRSVGRRAPGMFVSILRRKAESAGASVIEFSTRTTRLSQYDHTTGEYVKKPLSQRYHEFPDGSRIQRDLYSAWLARYVHEDKLDATHLRSEWAVAEPLLRQAASRAGKPTSRRASAAPHARKGVRVGCLSKVSDRSAEAAEV